MKLPEMKIICHPRLCMVQIIYVLMGLSTYSANFAPGSLLHAIPCTYSSLVFFELQPPANTIRPAPQLNFTAFDCLSPAD